VASEKGKALRSEEDDVLGSGLLEYESEGSS
jgi:hypothetical protein